MIEKLNIEPYTQVSLDEAITEIIKKINEIVVEINYLKKLKMSD